MNLRHDKITIFVLRPDSTARSHELLQLRRTDDFLAGTWQMVRGTIESGETAPQTALRELREETGFTPREFYRFGSVETFYFAADDAICLCAAFAALVNRDAVIQLNDEHDAHRWIPLADADTKLTWPSERALLPELKRDILGESLAKAQLRIEI